MTDDIDPNESPVKAALDNAELFERVPALHRDNSDININERGGPVLVIPRHPLVRAFHLELEAINLSRDRALRDAGGALSIDLKTARRRYRAAAHKYNKRVMLRTCGPGLGMMTEADERRHVQLMRSMCLSAILIDRAEARLWRKIVTELEAIERVKKHNARSKRHHASNIFARALTKAVGDI